MAGEILVHSRPVQGMKLSSRIERERYRTVLLTQLATFLVVPGFSGGGGGCQAIIWQIFGRKLHVNERNMDREGVDVLSILFGICHWYVLVKEGDLCFNDFSAKLDSRSFHSFCRTRLHANCSTGAITAFPFTRIWIQPCHCVIIKGQIR